MGELLDELKYLFFVGNILGSYRICRWQYSTSSVCPSGLRRMIEACEQNMPNNMT